MPQSIVSDIGRPPNTAMNILRLLDELLEMIDGTKQFAGITFGLKRDEIGMQIAKIRASLPTEVKAAAATVRESDRIVETAREDATTTLDGARKEALQIIEEAKREAMRLLEQAKLEQDRMVGESEILKLSKAQSEEIRNSADRDAVEMRRGADKYAYDVLSKLEKVAANVMTAIDQGKQVVDRTEAPQALPRERTRV